MTCASDWPILAVAQLCRRYEGTCRKGIVRAVHPGPPVWSNIMITLKRARLAAPLAAVALGLSAPALAHHSFAAYDMNRTVSVDGTLKEFRWGAPHSSMVLIYIDKGQERQMSIVAGSPLMFSKQGLTPRDFRRGDKVKVVFHPNISGQPGGAMASLRLPSGKTFSDVEAARAGGN